MWSVVSQDHTVELPGRTSSQRSCTEQQKSPEELFPTARMKKSRSVMAVTADDSLPQKSTKVIHHQVMTSCVGIAVYQPLLFTDLIALMVIIF
ncbi:hypothetical protein LEMLEM_LOCUS4894 [Lemmus lemmus]